MHRELFDKLRAVAIKIQKCGIPADVNDALFRALQAVEKWARESEPKEHECF